MTPDPSEPNLAIRPESVNQASARLTTVMRSSLAKALAAGGAERTYGRILPAPNYSPPTLAVGIAAAPDGETQSVCRSEAPWRSRRGVIGFLAIAPLWAWSRRAQADSAADAPRVIELSPDDKRLLYDAVASKVARKTGYQSRIVLRDSVVRCVRHGVIDLGKFFALQRDGERMPDDLSHVLSDPSDRPIRLTRENAGVYVNLLWAVGLANHMVGNFSSPLMGDSLRSFASTAGWTLGDREEGADYFSKFPIVDLTPAQESLAIRVAKSTFRPCCDKSTFFQDCNHGSALYGLLQLGASQGLREADLYREAFAFNSFWFEHHYVRTALYFAVERGVVWRDADPKEVMGPKYSSLSQSSETIEAWAERNPDLFPQSGRAGEPKLDLDPQSQGGAKCGA
jgi:hypothetical protein